MYPGLERRKEVAVVRGSLNEGSMKESTIRSMRRSMIHVKIALITDTNGMSDASTKESREAGTIGTR